MLTTENICFAYPGQEKRVLHNITLEIAEGCFTAIVGHNGSGKSTFARLFNALLLPTEGIVTVDGVSTLEADKVWGIRSQVGMVFQNPDNQLVATTVEEDIAFGPENLGIPPAEIRLRVEEALARVHMEAFRKKAPHQLSGGQKQRIAIAGVLAMRPKYIFFDEATAMLDPQGRAEVMQTILELHKQGDITPILITHFMEEAAFAQRVIVMAQGNVVLDGTPKKIFSQIDTLKKLKLDIPAATEINMLLKKAGLQLPTDIITIDELVEGICLLK